MAAFPNAATIKRHTFANGLTVLVYENFNAGSVVITGSLLAGSVYEPLALSGLASMTAAGLMRGTTQRDFQAIHSSLEDIGADLAFNTGKFRVMFEGRALAEDFPLLLDVLADVLRRPIFPADEFVEERRGRLTELNYAQQNTRFMASRLFRQTIYPSDHPYHRFTMGSAASLDRLTAHDLRNFHAQYYSPQGMVLVVVGAVRMDEVLAQVEGMLGGWATAPLAEPTLPEVRPPQEMTTVHHEIAGKSQTDLVIGTLGLSRYAPDYHAAALANSILGEFGMMGRIGNIVREQLGLAYYAYSNLEAGQGLGTWHVVAGVAPENIDTALTTIHSELRCLVEEQVTETELDDNQSYFVGRLPLQLENNSGIGQMIHALERYDLGLDYLLDYRQRIYGITRADVLAAAQHYLDPDKLVIASAGPTS